jgi:hypothetical protein
VALIDIASKIDYQQSTSLRSRPVTMSGVLGAGFQILLRGH